MGQAPLSVWRSWMVRLPPKYFASERRIIDLAEHKNPTVKGVLRSPARWLETRDSRCVATRQSASCRNTYGTSSAERAVIVGGPPAALCTPRAKYYVVLYSLISSLATSLNFQCLCLRTSAAANAARATLHRAMRSRRRAGGRRCPIEGRASLGGVVGYTQCAAREKMRLSPHNRLVCTLGAR